jgi:cytoskeletal protein RodZ
MRQYAASRNKLIVVVCITSAALLALVFLVLAQPAGQSQSANATVAPSEKGSSTGSTPAAQLPAGSAAEDEPSESFVQPPNSSSEPAGDADHELFKGLGSSQAPKNAPKRPGDPIPPPPTKSPTTPGNAASGQGGTTGTKPKTGTETAPRPKPATGTLLPGDEGYR